MSEKIYAWLLRLYPSQFREAYRDEALQLFRDRARDEKGFFLGIRLWLDLLTDFIISVPREYRYVRHALAGASARGHDGMPLFCVLEDEPPRLGALLIGGLLSLVFLGAVSIGIRQAGNYAGLEQRAPSGQQAMSAPNSGADGAPNDPQSNALLRGQSSSPQQQDPQPQPQNAVGATTSVLSGEVKLDAAERHRVIDTAVADLKQYYIDPEVAQKIADSLLAHENSGDYNAIRDGEAFADLLTTQMRDVSHDNHLILAYSQVPTPEQPLGSAERFTRYRRAMEQDNCTFETVEILPHNIGYLKLNSFPDASICQSTATAAMASVNRAGAIIFDLRDNTGGFPNMVSLIAAYLFDHPEYMYNPRENTTEQSWTQSPVPGNRLADKPVYILTSARTFSGAEQFSYDLKMLRRATLVGETTRGGAHAGIYHRIDDHFGMGITEVRPINPFSRNDWDGTGVEPDVKVRAADALDTAERLAKGKLAGRK